MTSAACIRRAGGDGILDTMPDGCKFVAVGVAPDNEAEIKVLELIAVIVANSHEIHHSDRPTTCGSAKGQPTASGGERVLLTSQIRHKKG